MDSLDVLGQALECSVCLEQLNATARVLPCQHTFCYKCLSDIYKTQKELRCPECRAEITVPLEKLQTNILLMRILEGMKSLPFTSACMSGKVISETANCAISRPKNQGNSLSMPGNQPMLTTTLPSGLRAPADANPMPFSSIEQPSSTNWGNNLSWPNNTPHVPVSTPLNTTPWLSRVMPGGPTLFPPSSSTATNSLLNTPDTSRFIDHPAFRQPMQPSTTHSLSYVNPMWHSLNSTQSVPRASGPTQNTLLHAIYDSTFPRLPPAHFEGHPIQSKNPFIPLFSAASDSVIRNKALSAKQAVALFAYRKKEIRDLGFQKGDILTVVKKIDNNWYQGELNGELGFFPASYVKILDHSLPIPEAVALFDFNMGSTSNNCICFRKNQTITVIKFISEEWAEGKLDSHRGLFPLKFVKLNDAAQKLLDAKRPNGSFPATTTAATVSDQPMQATVFHSGSVGGQLPKNMTAPSSSRILSGSSSEEPSDPEETISTLYVCTFPYTPRKADELELEAGGLYEVHSKCYDGWFKGRSVSTNKVGVFPGGFVKASRTQVPLLPLTMLQSLKHSLPESSDRVSSSSLSSSSNVPEMEFIPPRASRTQSWSSSSSSSQSSQAPEEPNKPVTRQATFLKKFMPNDATSEGLKISDRKTSDKTKKPPVPLMRERYRCIAPYPPNSAVELQLQIGEIVYVHSKREDGWCKGTSLSTGRTGLFPASFVEPC